MPLMTNAEAFLYDFGIYATELWVMTGEEFLKWLIAECDRERPKDMIVHLEQLTDKEQRIFLAAMGREEEVCKQVDVECRDCREPYEDTLVSVCHEIIRKVKGALWT